MDKLIEIHNRQAVVSSRQVADSFGKRHDKLFTEIERMYNDYIVKISMSKMVDTPLFYENIYVHPQNNQRYKEYLMNKDGFSLLVMGFTGEKAIKWKIEYINAFNEMEKQLTIQSQKALPQWQDMRTANKQYSKAFNEAVKQFIEYAIANGSKHAKNYYTNFNKLINHSAGVKSRDNSTVAGLNNTIVAMQIATKCILQGIKNGLHYKEIYNQCKTRINTAYEYGLLTA